MARDCLCQALQFFLACHARGVLHRDLKDKNLIVNLHWLRLSLIDFDSPAAFSSERRATFMRGSITMMLGNRRRMTKNILFCYTPAT